LVKQLNRIGSKTLPFKPAETLRSFLVGPDQKHLFTFLRIPGVESWPSKIGQGVKWREAALNYKE
jgi:hypothetical protein